MYAMQYQIPLPADYDMRIIHERVASKGHLTDDYPDLGLKAYLVRERGIAGADNNEYAPFYVWTGTGGMNRFLWSGTGFSAIVASFGRPPVRHFVGAGFRRGPDWTRSPMRASRRIAEIVADADPTAAVAAAVDELAALAASDTLHSAAVVIDPCTWTIVTFGLWTDTPPPSAGRIWQVLHLSQPHAGEITA